MDDPPLDGSTTLLKRRRGPGTTDDDENPKTMKRRNSIGSMKAAGTPKLRKSSTRGLKSTPEANCDDVDLTQASKATLSSPREDESGRGPAPKRRGRKPAVKEEVLESSQKSTMKRSTSKVMEAKKNEIPAGMKARRKSTAKAPTPPPVAADDRGVQECTELVMQESRSLKNVEALPQETQMPKPCQECAELRKDNAELKVINADLQGKKKILEQEKKYLKDENKELEGKATQIEDRSRNDVNKISTLKASLKARDDLLAEKQQKIASLEMELAKYTPILDKPRPGARGPRAKAGIAALARPKTTQPRNASSIGKGAQDSKRAAPKKRSKAKTDVDEIDDLPKKRSNHVQSRNKFADRMTSSIATNNSALSNATKRFPPPRLPVPAHTAVTDSSRNDFLDELRRAEHEEQHAEIITLHFNKYMQEKSHNYGKISDFDRASQDPPTQAIGSLFSFSKNLPHIMTILPKPKVASHWNMLLREQERKAKAQRRSTDKMQQLRAIVGPMLLSIDIAVLLKNPTDALKDVNAKRQDVVSILLDIHERAFHCFEEQHFRPLYGKFLSRAVVDKLLGREPERMTPAGLRSASPGEEGLGSPLATAADAHTGGSPRTPALGKRLIDVYRADNGGSPAAGGAWNPARSHRSDCSNSPGGDAHDREEAHERENSPFQNRSGNTDSVSTGLRSLLVPVSPPRRLRVSLSRLESPRNGGRCSPGSSLSLRDRQAQEAVYDRDSPGIFNDTHNNENNQRVEMSEHESGPYRSQDHNCDHDHHHEASSSSSSSIGDEPPFCLPSEEDNRGLPSEGDNRGPRRDQGRRGRRRSYAMEVEESESPRHRLERNDVFSDSGPGGYGKRSSRLRNAEKYELFRSA